MRTQLNIRLPVPTTSQSADAFDGKLESSKEGISEVKQDEQISGRLQTKEPCDTSNGYAALELDISVDVLDEVEEYITPINSDEDEEDTKVNVKYKRTTDEVSSDELVDETESCKDPDIEWQPASMVIYSIFLTISLCARSYNVSSLSMSSLTMNLASKVQNLLM